MGPLATMAFRTPFLITLFISVLMTDRVTSKTDVKELTRDREGDDRPLIFTTLGGGMVALEQATGNVLWNLKEEPVVKVPNDNDDFVPQFLPDPRHGSLYMLGERQILKKLPFTIPQLVANAPCRSSDGILYTGKKIDTWFMIDPKTGVRKQVLGYEKNQLFDDPPANTCPIDPKNAIFVARTEYNILMYDSKNENHRWNITYFDYSSHSVSSDYGIVHFTSASNGRIMSFDRKTGQMIWSHDMQSPVVAAYLLDREGLISVPFNAVGDDTMNHIMDDVISLHNGKGFKHSNIELIPSLYVGEHNHGLYAISSLIDKSTNTISSDGSHPLLLEGPIDDNSESRNFDAKSTFVHKKKVRVDVQDEKNEAAPPGYLLLGHYTLPEDVKTNFKLVSSKSTSLSLPITFVKTDTITNTELKLIVGPSDESSNSFHENESSAHARFKFGFAESDSSFDKGDGSKEKNGIKLINSVASQTEREHDYEHRDDSWRMFLKNPTFWFNQQEHKGIKFAIVLVMAIVLIMFFYLRNQILIFQQMSQSGSRFSNSQYLYNGKMLAVPEELDNGMIKVGKIYFHPEKILGKGCEGTFVYKGTFENRDVAVKRLLPECFSFADREVALLSESDAHANVIRYYCMEQDRLFRYIALELCSATLQDYVQNNLEDKYEISKLEIIRQATSGLAHLHSLDIVHRDIKPHNVLLSVSSSRSSVKAMISDFGLCKKLNYGRTSFSRRSGVTGTEGWIAPEMIKGERTTTSVDIFSLGCVFHYVLTKGIHPFGGVLERQARILSGSYDFSDLKSKISPEDVELATCLIKTMLESDSQKRPPAVTVHNFPLFWDKQQILGFFQDVSDRVEKDPPGGPLENGGSAVVYGDWRERVSDEVAADLRRYRSYRGESVRDLLRALRNKKHHYRELTEEAQKSLGSIPEEFTSYWLKRFPRLLLHTWLQIQTFREEDVLKRYYVGDYEFDKDHIVKEIDIDDLKKYEGYMPSEVNNLFIKSKNYQDYSKGKPNRKYFENTRNSLTISELQTDDQSNVPPRVSPLKNPSPGGNTKRYNKYARRNVYNKTDPHNLQGGGAADITQDNNKTNVRNRKQANQEAGLTWVLPNQMDYIQK